jgi:flagellar biosynthesis protein FlhF
VTLGPALDCVARQGLPLHDVANGQRVPEDLHAPSARHLVHPSLRVSAVAALALAEDDYAARAVPGAAHAAA